MADLLRQARWFKSPRALREGRSKCVCVRARWSACTIILYTVCDHSPCVATGVQRAAMPKCLFYRAGDLHRTLSRQRGRGVHTHTKLTTHSTHLAARHGSLILLSHCVLGRLQRCHPDCHKKAGKKMAGIQKQQSDELFIGAVQASPRQIRRNHTYFMSQ